jgi:hypothetical protein
MEVTSSGVSERVLVQWLDAGWLISMVDPTATSVGSRPAVTPALAVTT